MDVWGAMCHLENIPDVHSVKQPRRVATRKKGNGTSQTVSLSWLKSLSTFTLRKLLPSLQHQSETDMPNEVNQQTVVQDHIWLHVLISQLCKHFDDCGQWQHEQQPCNEVHCSDVASYIKVEAVWETLRTCAKCHTRFQDTTGTFIAQCQLCNFSVTDFKTEKKIHKHFKIALLT